MASPDAHGEAAFTAEDALAVARHLQEFPSVVLVGGQSLNFWAEQFRADVPDLDDLAPFQSSDVDFLGSIPEVQACAKKLGGTVVYPSPDQINTPEVGVVHCVINDKRLKIDFLGYLAGLNSSEVRKSAISIDVAGVVLRVMHPIHVVESRLANILQLRRQDSLAMRQMRVSIIVIAEFLRRAARIGPKTALKMIEQVFEITAYRDGIKLWHDFSIDIFDAIRPFDGLAKEFKAKRLPQMQELLQERRERHKMIQARVAAKKRKLRS